MKKRISINILLIVFILFCGHSQLMSQDASAILAKMDNIMFSPKDKQGKITITLTGKNEKEKVREAIMMQKGTDKRLYRYTQPESQAGIATLSLPGDVMWMYMPALGKPKKISLLARSQSFTGTDFSYEDMATTPYAERYVPMLIRTEANAYVMQLSPLSKDSKYSYIIATLDKTNGYPIKMEFYDKKEKKFKEATYQYEKIGKYWNAKEVVMTDLDKNHSTSIQLSDVKFDQGLSDDLFTVENLGKKD
jgi:outer membrane lipoprotein-sorting protein